MKRIRLILGDTMNVFRLLLVFLVFIAILLIIFSFIPNSIFSNLLLNLGTGLLGIVFVIGGLEDIKKRNNEKNWKRSKDIILKKIEKFNNKYNTYVRVFFNIEVRIPFEKEPNEENFKKFNIDVLDLTETEILPNIADKILVISTDNWKKFYSQLKELNKDVTEILMIFGNKIDPESYFTILSIQTAIDNCIESYETLPELFVYPLPPDHKFDGEYLKKEFAKNLKNSLKIAIDLNKRLINKD